MARTLTTQDITWFLDLNDKGQLNLDPPYQRRSVWSPRDKRYFIDTILNNYPAPPVFLHKTLNENGRATYHVVDGKQRLQTIIDFTQNKVRIPDDFSDITLQKKRWQDLERTTKDRFWNYSLIVEILPDVSEAVLRNTFERINRNARKLTSQEMRHAKYDGWFIQFVEAEAEKTDWKDFGLVTTARSKRMLDVQFISELCAVVMKGSITGFDQDALDELYAEYEDTSEVGTFVEDDFVAEIDRIRTIIAELLKTIPELKDYLKVQIHLYSLWAYLHLERHRFPGVDDFAKQYLDFMKLVTAITSSPNLESADEMLDQIVPKQAGQNYASNSRGASTDLTPRKNRHKGLLAGLHGIEVAAHEDC
jgi:hypothetical protein